MRDPAGRHRAVAGGERLSQHLAPEDALEHAQIRIGIRPMKAVSPDLVQIEQRDQLGDRSRHRYRRKSDGGGSCSARNCSTAAPISSALGTEAAPLLLSRSYCSSSAFTTAGKSASSAVSESMLARFADPTLGQLGQRDLQPGGGCEPAEDRLDRLRETRLGEVVRHVSDEALREQAGLTGAELQHVGEAARKLDAVDPHRVAADRLRLGGVRRHQRGTGVRARPSARPTA